MSSTAAQIADRLKVASDAYYNGVAPVMSDAEFDTLQDKLRKLDPNHPQLAAVGAPATGGWQKVSHAIPMGSLNKAQTAADFDKWAASTGMAAHDFCTTEKLDGISIELTYEGGHFTQGVTRGDGEIGEDITRNVKLMKGYPRIIPVTGTVYVRGEIVVRKSDFAIHFKGESNPRNTASGTAKRQSDADKCRHLTIVAYQWLPGGDAPATKQAEMIELAKHGFTVPAYGIGSAQYVGGYYEQYVQTTRAGLDWLIDGLVIDVNDRDKRMALGDRNGRPAGAIAYKFPHEEKTTTLRDIRWQVGASGRVTPVAEFDVVVIGGANIKQASLHNLDHIEAIAKAAGQACLSAGDLVLVSRRNDVIPFVESVVKRSPAGVRLTAPIDCPECRNVLQMQGAYLVCNDHDNCPAQVSGGIKRWIQKVGVLHFGEALIEALIEQGYVATLADLYRVDVADATANLTIRGKSGAGTVKRAFANLNKKRELPLHVFVGALGIPLIGRSMAQTIHDAGFSSLNLMSKATVKDIASIPGVGSTKAQAFCDGYWGLLDNGTITGLLSAGVTIAKPKTGPLAGQSFCMTGTRDPAIRQAMLDAGATEKSGVSKGLSILIAKDPNGTSGKLAKALRYGSQVIGVEDAWLLVGGQP